MKNANLTPPTASQAYIYIRLSSQAQAWGDGERRQHDAAVRFVETHSLPVAETMQDIGVSAFRGDNAQTGELGRFLQRIENGEIQPGSLLVAESLGRLTRNRGNQALMLLLNVTRHGARSGLTAQNAILDLASCAAFFPILADMVRSNSEPEHRCPWLIYSSPHRERAILHLPMLQGYQKPCRPSFIHALAISLRDTDSPRTTP